MLGLFISANFEILLEICRDNLTLFGFRGLFEFVQNIWWSLPGYVVEFARICGGYILKFAQDIFWNL